MLQHPAGLGPTRTVSGEARDCRTVVAVAGGSLNLGVSASRPLGVSRRGTDPWDVTDGFCGEAGTPASCLYRAEDPALTRFLWDVYFFFFFEAQHSHDLLMFSRVTGFV